MDDAGPLSRTRDLDLLRRLDERVLWLACWMIHNANHLRPSRDGLKVGGHQASSASVATILTALYLARQVGERDDALTRLVARQEPRLAVRARRGDGGQLGQEEQEDQRGEQRP